MRADRFRIGSNAWLSLATVFVTASACAHRGGEASRSGAFIIEKPALMWPGSATPRYPPELLATGDTGTVVIRLAVTPSGRADMKSVEVIASPHAAFTRAVVEVLPQARFVPAEIVKPGQCERGCHTDEAGVQWCRADVKGGGTTVRSVVDIRFVFAPPVVKASSPAPPPG